jgi:hypothetical protein
MRYIIMNADHDDEIVSHVDTSPVNSDVVTAPVDEDRLDKLNEG